MINEKEIKQRFVEFCRKHAITQTKIAAISETPLSTANRWFQPETQTLPSLAVIGALNKHYGLDYDWLLFGENAATETQSKSIEERVKVLEENSLFVSKFVRNISKDSIGVFESIISFLENHIDKH